MSNVFTSYYALSPYWVDLLGLTYNAGRHNGYSHLAVDDETKTVPPMLFDYRGGVYLGRDRQVAEALVAALKFQLYNMKQEDIDESLFEDTFVSRIYGVCGFQLPKCSPTHASTFEIVPSKLENEDIFVMDWQSAHPWPCGLWFPLEIFAELYLASLRVALKKNTDMPAGVKAAGTGSRSWPTRWHALYIDRGTFFSGYYTTPLYVLEQAAHPSKSDSAKNIEGLISMGYTEADATILQKSDILGIKAWILQFLSEPQYPGASNYDLNELPRNEYHPYNPPQWIAPIEPGSLSGLELWLTTETPTPVSDGHTGLLLDKNYFAAFEACSIAPHGWYGFSPNPVFRDQTKTWLAEQKMSGRERVRHYSIPIIDVDEVAAADHVIQSLAEATHRPLFFRGQTKPYWVAREAAIRQLLFGADETREPSLQTADARAKLNYEDFHPVLQFLLQDHMYAVNGEDNLLSTNYAWKRLATGAASSWDIGVMAIAQHYGIPTHGLDITESWKVALWFATNKYCATDGAKAWYEELSDQHRQTPRESWPVIYVFCPLTSTLESSIRHINPLGQLGVDALRAARQKAHFFTGGQGAGTNRLAEALICILRLKPGKWSSGLTFAGLFPNSTEDHVYGYMLDLKKRYASGPYASFFSRIVEYICQPR
ncbi:FRG domain-containing protein [Granulicella sp. L46]|uniref:FRG domain-containing protein n=1 Tax=Granulicella sp. L46 TaxID=1641865 RepID=UPI00131E52B9|nr:FRG domain-containing protein [Granulicella sp. L46]